MKRPTSSIRCSQSIVLVGNSGTFRKNFQITRQRFSSPTIEYLHWTCCVQETQLILASTTFSLITIESATLQSWKIANGFSTFVCFRSKETSWKEFLTMRLKTALRSHIMQRSFSWARIHGCATAVSNHVYSSFVKNTIWLLIRSKFGAWVWKMTKISMDGR